MRPVKFSLVVAALALAIAGNVTVGRGQDAPRASPFGTPPAIPDEDLDPNDELAKGLASPRPEERLAALDRFEKERPKGTVRAVLRAMADPDPRVSLHATVQLNYLAQGLRPERKPREPFEDIEIPTPIGFDKLLAQTESPILRGLIALAWERSTPDVAKAMPRALKGVSQIDADRRGATLLLVYDRKFASELAAGFEHEDPEVRRGAARVLRAASGQMPASDFFAKAIDKALQDSDPLVRGFTVLARIRDDAFFDERLAKSLKDVDPFVRACATRSILERNSSKTVEWLVPLAQNDPSVRVRLRAIYGLREFISSREGEDAQNAAAANVKLEGISRTLFEHCSCANEPFTPWWPQDKQPLTATIADTMVAQISSAIDEELRAPLPGWREFWAGMASDNFDLNLLTWIAECSPASRTALPRLFAELRKIQTMGEGDDRCSAEGRRLVTIWSNLQYYATQGSESTQELVRALEDPHRVVRTVAALALSGETRYAAKYVPVLIDSLNHECAGHCAYDHVERWDVMSLAKTGHLAVPALLEQIRLERNVPLAVMALSYMSGDDERVVQQLLAAFEDRRTSTTVRRSIAMPLGQLGQEERKVREALLRCLQDRSENEEVRSAALHGLSRTDVNNLHELLIKFKDDESPKVREAARQEIVIYRRRMPE